MVVVSYFVYVFFMIVVSCLFLLLNHVCVVMFLFCGLVMVVVSCFCSMVESWLWCHVFVL